MFFLNRLVVLCVLFFGVFLTVHDLGFGDDTNASKSNYDKAVAYFQEEQFDPAIEFFQKALDEGHPPVIQSRIYNLIGLCYLRQGISLASAIGSFEQSASLDPRFAEAYFNIASAYAGEGKEPDKAVEYFKKTLEVDPQFYKAYFGLGWFTLIQGSDSAGAIGYFRKTLEQFPDFAEAHYGIGMAHIQSGKQHMALEAVSQLRALQRDDLASTLEKTITELSSPVEAFLAPPSSTHPAEGVSSVPPAGQAPFEVTMRGKLVPLAEETSHSK